MRKCVPVIELCVKGYKILILTLCVYVTAESKGNLVDLGLQFLCYSSLQYTFTDCSAVYFLTALLVSILSDDVFGIYR